MNKFCDSKKPDLFRWFIYLHTYFLFQNDSLAINSSIGDGMKIFARVTTKGQLIQRFF